MLIFNVPNRSNAMCTKFLILAELMNVFADPSNTNSKENLAVSWHKTAKTRQGNDEFSLFRVDR